MSMRKAPPGEVTKRAGVHFVYVPTSAGKPWKAYIAGPCWWLYGHCKGKTRPCLDWLTHGTIPCDHCTRGGTAEIVGYQPLWRESDTKPVCVIVHNDSRENVDSFHRPQGVMICRENGIGDGVYFRRPMQPLAPFQATMPEKLCDADITESCLRMWKIPALVTWYLAQTGQKHGGVLHPLEKAVEQPTFPISKPTDPVSSVGESIPEQFPRLGSNEEFVRKLKLNIGTKPPAE